MKPIICFSFIVGLFFMGSLSVSAQQVTGVDIIFQAQNSTVPPLYQGKNLGTPQGGGVFTAVPYTSDGRVVDTGNLTFKWKYDNSVVSGYTENTFPLQPNILSREPKIDVIVYSSLGVPLAEGQADFTFGEPTVLLYQHDPLLGTLFGNVLDGEEVLKGVEIQVVATPFYFKQNHTLDFSWELNGEEIQNTTTQDSVVFRNDSNISGLADIDVFVRSAQTILHRAGSGFSLRFE